MTDSLEEISQALLAAFPSQKDIDILLETCNQRPELCHTVSEMLHSLQFREGLENEADLAKITGPHTHPVLLARHMLVFSSLLMDLPLEKHILGLAEHHQVIMERLADTAIRLVTTNEELLGTIESLECVLLEGLYHLNGGDVRRGWLAFRRALMAAQLMGIHRPRCPPTKKLDPQSKTNPHFLWSHIVYMDRFLSLMLALPPGHADVRLESETVPASGTITDRLQCFHANAFAKILERNQLSSSRRALALTLDIDRDLRKMAESLPADFWRPPDVSAMRTSSREAFKELMRVRNQVTHFTLLNQLHLPYLLCPNRGPNEYSRTSCVYASREILTRFITFRSLRGISVCCRMSDFLTLVAGMTLILAHLDSHQLKDTDNLLAHQRLGDRATVEQALKYMDVRSPGNEGMLAVQCSSLLQHLLRIEEDGARRRSHGMDGAQWAECSHDGDHDDDECGALLIYGPHFGSVRIAPDGIKFMNALSLPQDTQDSGTDITIGGIGSVHIVDHKVASRYAQLSADDPAAVGDCVNSGGLQPDLGETSLQPRAEDIHSGTVSDNSQPTAAAGVGQGDFMALQDLYPGMAGGMNDWVFPNDDAAFLDSLMMQTDVQFGHGGAADG